MEALPINKITPYSNYLDNYSREEKKDPNHCYCVKQSNGKVKNEKLLKSKKKVNETIKFHTR